MALQYVEIDARCNPKFCNEVYLCLQSFWSSRTQSGIAIVKATVRAVLGQIYLQPTVSSNPCTPCIPVQVSCPADPCDQLCRYQLSIDDSQLLINPGTGQPYLISSGDVLEISQTVCLIDRLLSSGGSGEFSLVADGGPTQLISSGDVLTVVGQGVLTTTTSNPDILTISLDPGTDGQILTTVGTTPTWTSISGITIVADSGPNQPVALGGLLTLVGAGVLETIASNPDTVSIGIAPGLNGQVLSTVAGVPTWVNVPGASTDVLVDTGLQYPSGAAIMQHTAVNGTITSFANGFTSVQAAVGCVTPGVGVTTMIRSITIDPSNVLIVDAAPEHTALQSGAAQSQVLGLDISSAVVLADSLFGPININNPSACRSLPILVAIDYGSQFSFRETGTWRWEGLVSINGGPLVVTSAQQFGVFPGLIGLPGVMVAGDNFTIPPSGSRSYSLQSRVTTLVASPAGSLWNSSSKSIRVIGSTSS